jgi:DNA-directed RNA polymerase specialized sigma24 family protein
MPPTPTASAFQSETASNGAKIPRGAADYETLRAMPFKRSLEQIKHEAIQSPGRTREELLVTFCRWLSDTGKTDEAWDVAAVLTTRVKGRIARTLSIWRLSFPPALAEELIEEIIVDFYNSIFDKSASGQFWEVRFWVAFDRNLLDIVRRRRKQLDHVPAFNQEDNGFDDEPPSHSGHPDILSLGKGMGDPETATLVAEALVGLPEAVRTAYVLKHYAGFAEEAQGEGPTIASTLGVSGRTVRNYLARAEAHLVNWREGTLVSTKSKRTLGSSGDKNA